MIDNETGKEMHKVYTVEKIVECNDCGYCENYDYCQYKAQCEVTFHERFTDDDQHWLHLEYHFDSIWSDELNFRQLEFLVIECNLNINRLNTIRKAIKGNWEVKLTDDIVFRCHHEIEIPEAYYWCSNYKDTVDLGRIAECYDDCETCTKCHNFWNENCRDCDGCDAHPCTKINGRESLMKQLGVDSL